MFSNLHLFEFVIASLVLLIIPGPSVFYILTRCLAQGKQAGFISVLAASAGAIVHVVAATIGLSAIIYTSALAFNILKILGACYLLYLGIRVLTNRSKSLVNKEISRDSNQRVFKDGFVVTVLNPKLAVFFLAFLPQFITPESNYVNVQILLLGMVYVGLALITDSLYVLSANRLRDYLINKFSQGKLTNYLSGGTYIGLGIAMLSSERRAVMTPG